MWLRILFASVLAIASSPPTIADDLAPTEAAAKWSALADVENSAGATLPAVIALLKTSAGQSRNALWSELSGLSRARTTNRLSAPSPSLLRIFELSRSDLLPLLQMDIHDDSASSDDLIELMLKTQVFGADRNESVAFLSERAPATVARYIERERGLRRPVSWEYIAFEGMMRWKSVNLVSRAGNSLTLQELDDRAATFITIFNCLHGLNEGYREVILRDLGSAELFNAVIGGEKELYRLGTSGYRNFLHPVIIKGITESGSFEAFLESATPTSLRTSDGGPQGHRALVFLRVASTYGLIAPLLQTIKDRRRFVADVLAPLRDTQTLIDNVNLVLDVLLSRGRSKEEIDFKDALLDWLYDAYSKESEPTIRLAVGSVLAVYQKISGLPRDSAIDRAFVLSEGALRIPFDRLFTRDPDGTIVHRIFMRMDADADARQTFRAFRKLAITTGASVHPREGFTLIRFERNGRAIEIYANEPSSLGISLGIANIANALDAKRVETVIGRGHTSIVGPLQNDARRVLDNRIDDVAVVFVGSCGSDAAVPELISTFGYKSLVTTKGTGRQVINNTIFLTYIKSLLALETDEKLAIANIVNAALDHFIEDDRIADDIRTDASLYRVDVAAAFAAELLNTRSRTRDNRRTTSSSTDAFAVAR